MKLAKSTNPFGGKVKAKKRVKKLIIVEEL